jgi:hypothetical protein
MVAWALSALEAQTPQLWAAELAFISACPAGSMDEVALIHLFQAGMFADRAAVTALTDTDETTPRMRSAADEVRATLAAGGCPLPLITRAEQAYRAASHQAGFDGPLIVELTMLRLLVTIYQARWRSDCLLPASSNTHCWACLPASGLGGFGSKTGVSWQPQGQLSLPPRRT